MAITQRFVRFTRFDQVIFEGHISAPINTEDLLVSFPRPDTLVPSAKYCCKCQKVWQQLYIDGASGYVIPISCPEHAQFKRAVWDNWLPFSQGVEAPAYLPREVLLDEFLFQQGVSV